MVNVSERSFEEAIECGRGFPPGGPLLRLDSSTLSGKDPGEFRRSQNWIGGSRPGNAVFVPPPHTAVEDCMAALERFLHAEDDRLPVRARGGLAHVSAAVTGKIDGRDEVAA